MNTEHALRYFLLRQLGALKAQISAIQYIEITYSLAVQKSEQGFRAIWKSGGIDRHFDFAASDVDFYLRGDLKTSKFSQDSFSKNKAFGRRFCEVALGRSLSSLESPIEALEARPIVPAIIYTIIGICVFAFSGEQGLMVGLLLLVFALGELYGRPGQIALIFLSPALSFAGYLTAGLIVALAMLGLQFLDSDFKWRRLRTSLAFMATVPAIFLFLRSDLSALSAWSGALLVLGGAASACRALVGTHFRKIPLLLPFLAVGVFAEGRFIVGSVVFIGFIFDTAFAYWGYKLSPIQREQKLTPNGSISVHNNGLVQ